MPQKLLIILSSYEEQGLLQLAARLNVSPLYALRLCLVKTLYQEGLLHEKIYKALLCKLLERPAPPPEEMRVLQHLEECETFFFHDDLPPDLASALKRTETKFIAAARWLPKMTEREREFWLEEARRYDFLEASQYLLREYELLGLIGEAPAPTHDGPDGGVKSGDAEGADIRAARGFTKPDLQPLGGGAKPAAAITIYQPLMNPEKAFKELCQLIRDKKLSYTVIRRGGEKYARIELPQDLRHLDIAGKVHELSRDGISRIWIPLSLLEEKLKELEAEAR